MGAPKYGMSVEPETISKRSSTEPSPGSSSTSDQPTLSNHHLSGCYWGPMLLYVPDDAGRGPGLEEGGAHGENGEQFPIVTLVS
jgi:hypothetical protein